jgi:glycerate-2-kinase
MLRLDEHAAHASTLVQAALKAADPVAALSNRWSEAELGSGEVLLLAIGKASRPMALEALRRLGPRVKGAVVTAPPDQADSAAFGGLPVEIFPCDHPYPTTRNVKAAEAVRDFVTSASPDHTVLCLISGGGSAHLTLPAGDLTLEDIAAVTRELQLAGATIDELNCVRKHCEQLKGGRLAALCRARVVAYILSDVMGDKLDVISSGPTAPDPTTYRDALNVLEARGLLLENIARHLTSGALGEYPETPKPRDPAFTSVTNRIIASNRLVVDAVADAARQLGFQVTDTRYEHQGEAAEIASDLAATAERLRSTGTPAAVIIGGEATVTVGDSRGKGGPSQELALAWSLAAEARRIDNAALLTFSTDGRDGPTDAAGAIVTPALPDQSRIKGLRPDLALQTHDSHDLLDAMGALVRVPPTGTNLNHVAVLIIYPEV